MMQSEDCTKQEKKICKKQTMRQANMQGDTKGDVGR